MFFKCYISHRKSCAHANIDFHVFSKLKHTQTNFRVTLFSHKLRVSLIAICFAGENPSKHF